MSGREVNLNLKPQQPGLGRRFRQSQIVADVLAEVDLASERFLVIEDDNGSLLGIVETEDLLKRVSATSPIERRRWCEMPLGSAIGARLDIRPRQPKSPVRTLDPNSPHEIQGVTVSTAADDMAALILGDELYLRWSSIKGLLDNAVVDAVTGLPNRLVFDRRVEDEWERLNRTTTSLCVIMVDLDYFKQINDRFGHAVGDHVLREVGNVLRSQLRSYDLLVRYGGDEFAAVLSGCTADQLDIPIRRVQEGVRKIFIPTIDELPTMSLSIGAAIVQSQLECESTSQLVNEADECLYRAKKSGRDCAYVIDLNRPNPVPVPVEKQKVRLIPHSETASL